jgi:hypothetical protein
MLLLLLLIVVVEVSDGILLTVGGAMVGAGGNNCSNGVEVECDEPIILLGGVLTTINDTGLSANDTLREFKGRGALDGRDGLLLVVVVIELLVILGKGGKGEDENVVVVGGGGVEGDVLLSLSSRVVESIFFLFQVDRA